MPVEEPYTKSFGNFIYAYIYESIFRLVQNEYLDKNTYWRRALKMSALRKVQQGFHNSVVFALQGV